ncbi:MAG: homoserine dehydrogenase [Phycisphaerales bacterium]|nr:homoserine dehydrogenase [Phycisphaerales bacterium]
MSDCCGTKTVNTGPAAKAGPVVVLKFGSSVLPDEAALPTAVHEIYRHIRAGRKVIAVVSALGDTTDRLLSRAQGFVPSPDAGALAAWVATGEAQAAALLGLAVDRAGVPVTVLDSGAIGLRTGGPVLDSSAISLDSAAITRALIAAPVLVVPGFIGRDIDGRATLLGRGGSDLTALFIAAQTGAERCILLKDVDGLYNADPAVESAARRYRRVSYDDVLALSEGIVQHKAVRLARARGVEFSVAAIGKDEGTLVGAGSSVFHGVGRSAARPNRPLRVGLLGLGTVGRGVYDQIAARPDLFEVVGIAVRDVEQHASTGIARELLTDDPWSVVRGDCDVVVEAIGGLAPARDLIAESLRRGRDVVTANKAVIAAEYEGLEALAAVGGGRLLFSAAVGGGVPVVEAARRAALAGSVESIEGVLNGTTNFVLDRLADGVAFEDAVKLAQALGFAEADPSADLDGVDAANKLAVLARAAFGEGLDPARIQREGIRGVTPAAAATARRAGGGVRLVARLRREAGRLIASVSPEVLPAGHVLAGARDERNIAVIRAAGGATTVVSGRGAGRWPTAESVIGDLFELLETSAGVDGVIERAAAREVAA